MADAALAIAPAPDKPIQPDELPLLSSGKPDMPKLAQVVGNA